MTTPQPLGTPISLDQARQLIQEEILADKILILTNPAREFYYAFHLKPDGISIKYGSYSQDPNRIKNAPCSTKDLKMRREVIIEKLLDKWEKFPEHHVYAGPENIKHTWGRLATALNGSLRADSPDVLTIAAQNEATNYLREYQQLIKIRARQNGLDESQLHGAVSREVFKLQREGRLEHKLVKDMLDSPEEVITGNWSA